MKYYIHESKTYQNYQTNLFENLPRWNSVDMFTMSIFMVDSVLIKFVWFTFVIIYSNY